MSPSAAGGDGSPEAGAGDLVRQLNLRAWRNNRRRAERLAQLVGGLGDGAVGQQRELARSLSHEIVGSAGTFGHSDASELARRMEALLARVPDLTPAALAELNGLAQRIVKALAREPLADE